MLEILILINLCRRIGERVREKGRKAGGYQFMLVMFWFAGEIGAAVVTTIVLVVVHGADYEKYIFLAYIAAIVGAAILAWLAFQIVASLPPLGVESRKSMRINGLVQTPGFRTSVCLVLVPANAMVMPIARPNTLTGSPNRIAAETHRAKISLFGDPTPHLTTYSIMASATSKLRHPKGPTEPKPSQAAGIFLRSFIDSSVGSKVLTALTGLGLTIFALFHMIGNLKVFQGPDAINAYAAFLKHDLGTLIWIARAGLLTIFLLHLALAIRLKLRSIAARPIPYQYPGSVQATFASRSMIWTGIVVGLFILFHLAHFTFGWLRGVQIAPGKVVNYLDLHDAHERPDVYSMVVSGFSNLPLAILYIVAQIALFIHLSHGIQSSFQTLGLKNRRFAGSIKMLGLAVATTILVGNVAIVIAVQLGILPSLYAK
jgi:succinate dehydrogenase / fumarate reductase cytochrome b subunit